MDTNTEIRALQTALSKSLDEYDRLAANLQRLESLLLAAAPEVAKRAGVGTSGAQDEIRAGLANVGPYGSDVTNLFVAAGAERATAETKKAVAKRSPVQGAIAKALRGEAVRVGDGEAV